MTAPGGGGDQGDEGAARERLAREARATATALLDWVGTRVDDAAAARAQGAPDPSGASARPRQQSPGPCAWCPVCALVAAVRGEQPELTATLAEQASGLLVLLRLLVSAHATGAHDHHAPQPPAPDRPVTDTSDVAQAGLEVPWEVAPHATFDPDLAPVTVAPDEPRPAPERPTGKRGPRPSPRRQPGADASPVPTTAAPSTATRPAAASTTAAPSSTAPPAAAPAAPIAPDRPARGVQRIPVRRRSRPC